MKREIVGALLLLGVVIFVVALSLLMLHPPSPPPVAVPLVMPQTPRGAPAAPATNPFDAFAPSAVEKYDKFEDATKLSTEIFPDLKLYKGKGQSHLDIYLSAVRRGAPPGQPADYVFVYLYSFADDWVYLPQGSEPEMIVLLRDGHRIVTTGRLNSDVGRYGGCNETLHFVLTRDEILAINSAGGGEVRITPTEFKLSKSDVGTILSFGASAFRGR